MATNLNGPFYIRINRFQAERASFEAGRRLITEVVAEVRRDAVEILATGPYTTGRLATGIESRIRYTADLIIGRVGISGRRFIYAASVETGADRHYIPLSPKVPPRRLFFYWRKVGHFVSFQQVHHPGQKGKMYLRIPLARAAIRHNMRYIPYDHRA